MGLNTSHDAFDGTCLAFNRLRRFLLRSIGGSFPPHADKTLSDDYWYWGKGKGYSTESHKGLAEFFSHSDCEGEINPEMCKLIADELDAILPNVRKRARLEQAHGEILRKGGWEKVTKRFIDGCRLAYERNKPLEFR